MNIMSERVPLGPWAHPLEVADLPRTGTHLSIEADSEARGRIGEALDLSSLHSLIVDVVLTPDARGGVLAKGRISAAVTQSCVVTLEPVTGQVNEDFERRFHAAGRGTAASAETVLDLRFDEEDPSEPLEDHTLDVGAIAFETLALGLDPYPRAPNAVFNPEPVLEDNVEDETRSPFSVLRSLKNGVKNTG